MVTDEMMKRAVEAYRKDTGAEDWQLLGWVNSAIRAALEAALSAAEPVKTAFEVASKHIPEARVSLLSRAIRQGLNDYGWKNFGTLPEVLMGYIIEAERAEAGGHPKQPEPYLAVKALEWDGNDYTGWSAYGLGLGYHVDDESSDEECFVLEKHEGSSVIKSAHASLADAQKHAQADYENRILSALSAQVQDVAGETPQYLYDGNAFMADGETPMTAAEEVLAWLLIEKIGVPDDVCYSPNQAQEIIVRRLDLARELEQIDDMLDEGQGDDQGCEIEEEITRLRQLLSEADKREREARARALEDAALRVDAKENGYRVEARDVRRSYRDRRFCASVADRLCVAAASIRALQSEER